MLKKFKVPLISAVLGFAASLVFLIWFKNVHGVPGLLVWHPDIAMITTVFTVLLFVIPVWFVLALVVAFVTNKKNPDGKSILSKIFLVCSCVVNFVALVAASGLMIYVIFTGNRMSRNFTKLENPLHKAELNSLSSIAISSDPHWGNPKANEVERTKILERVGNESYDAFFCLGDISDWGDTKDGYEKPIQEINEKLGDMPFFGLMGNHDALIAGSGIFNTLFYENKKASQYYRMDFGDVHFIVLDLLWGAEEFGAAQEAWLVKTLEEIPQSEKVIVLSHAFFLSSGYVDSDYGKNWFDNPDMLTKLCPIFEKYNVDLVVSGHNHLMEILEKEGVTYVVIGAMGGVLDPVEYTSPYSVWKNNTSFGFMKMELTLNDEIALEFFSSDGNSLKTYNVNTK